MVKRLFFWNWLALAFMLVPTTMPAQETLENVADTIAADELDTWKRNLPQYDLKEFDWVDICYNPKYAVVTKDGKKGIYDMMLHRNVTEIEFRDLGFSKQSVAEDSASISLFYATKGIKRGIVSIYEPTNDVVSIWMDDPDEVYSLDECTTIDVKMTKYARKLLGRFIEKQQMDNAQIVILDSKSGHLKTWIALDADMKKENAGKLLVHSCAASLTKPFHTIMALENEGVSLDSICNSISYRQGIKRGDDEVMSQAIRNGYRRNAADRILRELTDTENPSTSPFILAIGYNSLVHNGTMIIPTLNGDSVNVENDVFSSTNLINLREVLRVDRSESPQLVWLSEKGKWLAYAVTENIYSEGDKEKCCPIGKQIQFAGVFPEDNPQYTVCIVADKRSLDVAPNVFSGVVNPLVKKLLK